MSRLISKARLCTWQLAFGSRRYHVVTLRYKNCDIMSRGSYSRLPERVITTVQAPGDRKNPPVLWLKYDFNINKTGIFAIHFYLFFSMLMMITTYFSTVELGSKFDLDWFPVTTQYRYRNWGISKIFPIRI